MNYRLQDLKAGIIKVAKFLEKEYTEKDYEKLAEHLKFSKFQSNKMVNLTKNDTSVLFKTDTFIRKGKSQAWHDFFTPELNDKANKWIKTNLEGTDISFPFIDIYS